MTTSTLVSSLVIFSKGFSLCRFGIGYGKVKSLCVKMSEAELCFNCSFTRVVAAASAVSQLTA